MQSDSDDGATNAHATWWLHNQNGRMTLLRIFALFHQHGQICHHLLTGSKELIAKAIACPVFATQKFSKGSEMIFWVVVFMWQTWAWNERKRA